MRGCGSGGRRCGPRRCRTPTMSRSSRPWRTGVFCTGAPQDSRGGPVPQHPKGARVLSHGLPGGGVWGDRASGLRGVQLHGCGLGGATWGDCNAGGHPAPHVRLSRDGGVGAPPGPRDDLAGRLPGARGSAVLYGAGAGAVNVCSLWGRVRLWVIAVLVFAFCMSMAMLPISQSKQPKLQSLYNFVLRPLACDPNSHQTSALATEKRKRGHTVSGLWKPPDGRKTIF